MLEEIINKKVARKTSFDSQKTFDCCIGSSKPSSTLQTPSTPPILRSPISRIKKQISLYERDSGSMTQTDPIWNNNNNKKSLQSARRHAEFYRFLSVDQRSISDTEDNVTPNQHEWDKRSIKTKSCANLKISGAPGAHLSASHSPGAVLVQEKYIDLPKRVARSFHGKTETDKANGRVENMLPNGLQKTRPRFTTTRVKESELNDIASKEN